MRALALVLAGLHGALALPATQSDHVVCTSDALSASLSRDGRSFCSSVLEGRCHRETTPTQYATYEPTVISQHCKCVLTTDTCEETATPTRYRSSADDAGVTSGTVTTGGSPVTLTLTQTQTQTSGTQTSGTQTSGTGGGGGSEPEGQSTTRPVTSSDPTFGTTVTPGSTSGDAGPGGQSTTRPITSSDPTFGSTAAPSSASSDSGPGGQSTTRPITSSDPTFGSTATPGSTSSNGAPSRANPSASASDSPGAGSGTGGAPGSSRGPDPGDATRGGGTATTTDPGSGSGSGSGSVSGAMPTSMAPNATATAGTSNRAGGGIATTLPPAASTTAASAPGPQQTVPAANFTQVKRTGAISEATCYHLPQDPLHGRTRRSLLRNDELRQRNYTIPFPYIESVDFGDDGVAPLFLTLRDAARGTHYIDVSRRSQLSIVDSLGNAMTLDGRGIHFSTNSCRYDVSLTIDGLYARLATLSGQVCSKGRLVLLERRIDNTAFRQTVNLRDQCGGPVGRAVRRHPLLRVGDSECSDAGGGDDGQGRWLFDCAFPGAESGAMRCQRAVASDVVKFLFVAPFGGACPDLSTVITTLEASSQDFLTPASLRAELYDKGLDEAQRADADLAVMYYEQLWEILKQAFSKTRTKPPGRASAIQEYVDTYSAFGSFEADVCRDLHAPDPPLNMSLRAGASWLPAVAVLSAPPPRPPPALNLTIQDQSKVACCPRGSVSNFAQAAAANASCAYPDSALIAGSGCVCGRTAAGASVAFEYSECDNFVARCATDADCATEGHPGFLCLTGSCCGSGVCIDPYECSRNGTGLLERLALSGRRASRM